MKTARAMTLVLAIGVTSLTFADAPVVSLNSPSEQPVAVSAQSQNRLRRVEQQVANLNAMNLPSQIAAIQQQIQQLTGQIQVQGHSIAQLQQQEKAFYQDLNQRLTKLQAQLGHNGANASAKQLPALTAAPATKSSTFTQSEASYQSALSDLYNKRYKQASAAMQNYINKNPKGQFVANAHYWLGEIYYLQGNKALAKAQFNRVVKQFPKSNKVADSRLKLAFIQADAGQLKQAQQALQKIQQQYPHTSIARLANLRLQSIKTQLNQ